MLLSHKRIMSTSRHKQSTTRNTIASKLATMASPANECSSNNDDGLSMGQLVEELSKQRASLREDISILIQESIGPLQSSVNAIKETVDTFQRRLTATECLAGENFEKIFAADAAIKSLQAQNTKLLDRIEDLENRSRRSNLRIVNVPEGSEGDEDPVAFMSNMLMEIMGREVFDSAPTLERSHRVGKKPEHTGRSPRPFVVCFQRFQEKERVLQWARRHDLKYKNSTLRIYPDFSVSLSRRRAEFNDIKQALYKKGIKFQLLYPACLRVSFGGNTLKFDTPEDAKAFYNQQVMTPE